MSPVHLRTRSHLLGQAALAVVLGYAVFAALWILLSDSAVEALFKDPEQIILASMIKGWLFVAVTTLLLFILVKRQIHLLNEAHQREIESFHARQHSHDLLSAIVENSVDAIYAKDKEGRFLLFNAAASRIVGKPSANVLGQDDRSLFPPEQASALIAVDQRVMTSGETLTTEENLETASGRRILLATKGPLRDARRNIIGTFGISRDITDIKRAEAALRQSESSFRALVEQALAGIYIIQDGYFRYVNPEFAAIFGYDSPSDLIDRIPVSDLVRPEDRELVAENVRRRTSGEISDILYEFVGLRRDGTHVNLEVHGRAFEYLDRPAVIGLLRDVTASKQAERILAESESRFRALVEQSAAGIYIVQDNRFCYVNPYFAQLAGYDSPQDVIEHVQFMDLVVPEQRAMIADKIRKRMTGDSSDNHYTVTGLRRDGSRIEVELHGNIIQYRGRPALIGLFIDISARAAAAAELRARNAELERFNRVTVGREIDMIELKQRINALSLELGRTAPYDLGFMETGNGQSEISHVR